MRRNERGIALLLCIMSLMVLTGIAIGLMYMTDSETLVNANYRSAQQAYDAALAGLQNTRQRMTPGLTAAQGLLSGPTALPGTSNSIMYVVNPFDNNDNVTLTQIKDSGNAYYDRELQNELASQKISIWPQPSSNYIGGTNLTAEFPASNSSLSSTGPYMGPLRYKWVRVTWKTNASTAPYCTNGDCSTSLTSPVCWDGTREQVVAGTASCLPAGGKPSALTPVYQLTALAVTTSNSSRMLQMEVAQDPPITTPGAVDSQDHVDLSGSLDVNAYDYCSCTCVLDSKGNCTGTYTSRTGQTCDASKYSLYASGTVDKPNSSETFESGQNPAIAQNQPWPYDLASLVSRFSQNAVNVTGSPYNWTCSPQSTGDPLNCGNRSAGGTGTFGTVPSTPPLSQVQPSDTGYQVTYVPGDVQLDGNWSGFGVLVVNGNLNIHGGFNFDGLIIVSGVISFTGGGSDKVNVNGAIIAGQQSLIDNELGGSANIRYNACALPGPNTAQPPRSLATRELNF